MDERLERFIRSKARAAGRTFESARRAYREGTGADAGTSGRTHAAAFDLPTDAEGRARIVCRRHGERRAVAVDAEGRPACFEADHADCEGCAEDVRADCVETWEPDSQAESF